jgi:hypothetical protein
MSDVRRIIGVRPVESSSSRLVRGPGSEKRTRFLDFVLRPGVVVEADPSRTVTFRAPSVCCNPALLRVRRSERGSCDSSDIFVTAKIRTRPKPRSQTHGLGVHPFNRGLQLQRDSQSKQVAERKKWLPSPPRPPLMFVCFRFGKVGSRPERDLPGRCIDSTHETQSFWPNKDPTRPPSRYANSA